VIARHFPLQLLRLFELALVLVRLDQIANIIINARIMAESGEAAASDETLELR
jgi:hypothetical protein